MVRMVLFCISHCWTLELVLFNSYCWLGWISACAPSSFWVSKSLLVVTIHSAGSFFNFSVYLPPYQGMLLVSSPSSFSGDHPQTVLIDVTGLEHDTNPVYSFSVLDI